MPREGKRQINVYVDRESYENLRAFADENGCTVTAFIDALGRVLGRGQRSPRWLEDVVKEARKIDADRRKRPS